VQFPIRVELHRSFILSCLLVVFHTLAVGCVVVLPWPWAVRAALFVVVGLSLWHAMRPSRIVGLCVAGRDRLDGLLADGNRVALTILPDSAVFVGLIVLRMRIGEEKRSSCITLLPDQMTVEQFRLLRTWLRWHTVLPRNDVGTIS
jgi:hypothetical protein